MSVALNPSSASVAAGAQTQFTATVQNTTNTAVTWSVDTIAGGNSTVGTISTAGLYTAPSQAGTHTVTATSMASTTARANAAVTVTAAPVISISLSPTSASIAVAASTQFTATVQNATNTAVTWYVDTIAGGSSTVGTISASGVYTAPITAGTHTVTATSVADTADSASAIVTVNGLVISPATAIVAASGAQQFTAAIANVTSTPVSWFVDQVAGGNATVGTISATGLYIAPTTLGTHTITAATVANSAITASASITVTSILLSPMTAALVGNATQQFTATMPGVTNPAITWSATGGTISASGFYTAPSQAGSYTVTATSTVDPALTASAAVSVILFTVSPPSATVAPSGSQQFTATIQGVTNQSVTWSVDGVVGGNATTGTITTGGLYSAPDAIGGHTVTATSVAEPAFSVNVQLTVINTAQAAVLTYHNDDARDGAYLEEVNLTPTNVNSTQFGKLLSYPVDPVNGQIYGQPLYVSGLSIAGGTHDVVFVVTQNNSVYAFDADATSPQTAQTFWQDIQLGPPVTKNSVYGVSVVGILSTPVIDATTNTMYLVAEISGKTDPTPYYLYALDITTGVTELGSPVNITGSVPGTGGDSSNGYISLESSCYQRMGLALDPVSNQIYIGFGDCTHGWLLAYDKTTLAQTAIFNDTPDGDGGGMWSSGGAPAIDDTTGDLYLITGVDELSPGVGDPVTTGYNDSFLQLDPNSLSVLDFFTPDDNLTLSDNDADLGSGGNILVPNNSSSTPHETIGGGKDGNVFIVNRDNMGGYNPDPPQNKVIQEVQICTDGYNNIFSTPVYWNGSIYYHCNNDVVRAFSWNATTGLLSTTPTSVGTAVYQTHGATASLSANGAVNGIIWDIDNTAYNGNDPAGSGPSVLHAYNATNVANQLYNSSQAGNGRDTAGAASKFTSPTIANGKVFVPTSTELDVYGLLPQ
ncbi:MAG: hypothetical protein ABSH02_04425 [Candidatus Sulfotelmatobacter sp.]